MTKTQLKIAAELLELAADQFGNHGCNDYEIKNTKENLEFVKQMIAFSDDPDEKPEVYRGKILICDFQAMQYLSDLLEKESNEPHNRKKGKHARGPRPSRR